jgi:O-antigen/teichoic acid export membrane protein/glycosyltransferase involved in cell wall biosynthesis
VTSSPTVSIAIRAYRREWLGEAIASVLAQTYSDLELTVYDDAGDLDDVAASFADPRLRYHRAAERLDAAGRYKAALALCQGAYVGLLDDDDRYEPEFVERLVGSLGADPSVGVVSSGFVWEWDGRRVLSPSRPAGRQTDAERWLLTPRTPWSITPSTTLLRRTMLLDGEHSLPLLDGVAPDMLVNVRAAAAGWGFVHVDEPLVVRRWHAAQLSRSRVQHDVNVTTWQQLERDDPELEALRRQNLARALVRRSARRLLDSDASGARADLREARRQSAGFRRWSRRALRVATAVPTLGRAGLRLYFASPPVRRRLEQPPEERSRPGLGRGAAAVATGGVVAQALFLLSAPALTRLYTPAAFGAASVVIGAMAVGVPLACLRFDVAIPIARGRAATADVCRLCLVTAAAIVAALALVVAFAGGPIARAAHIPSLAGWLWVVPLRIGVAAVGLVVAGLLVRKESYRVLGRTRWARAGAISGGQLAAGGAGAGPPGLIAGVVLGEVAFATAGLRVSGIRSRLRDSPGWRLRQTMRRYGRFAAWSSVGAGVFTLGVAALPVFVVLLYGPAAGGLFVLAQRLVQAPVQVAGDAVGVAWFGTAARLVRTDASTLRASFARVTLRLSVVGVVLLPVAILAGPPLLAPVFGEQWGEAGQLLPALAIAQLCLFVATPAGQVMQTLERTGLQAIVAAGRLAAGVGALACASALDWSLAAGLELYAVSMVAISAAAVAVALRLAGNVSDKTTPLVTGLHAEASAGS